MPWQQATKDLDSIKAERAAKIEAKTDLYEERIVTASRREQGPLDAPNSTSVVTRQDIRLSGITRLPELLRRVAGMDVMQITGGDANVSMRGLNSRLSNKLPSASLRSVGVRFNVTILIRRHHLNLIKTMYGKKPIWYLSLPHLLY